MRGIHEVVVQNNRVQYKFAIRRNLTILRGDSATGKSTLIDLIAQYVRDGKNSGVVLRCDKPCIVLTSDLWEIRLSAIKDSIVFIDEDNSFAATYEFAEKAKNSDNYYVIVMRESLPQLPYSVDEIYTLKNRTKGYGQIKRLYTSFQHIYERSSYEYMDSSGRVALPDVVDYFIDFYEDRKAHGMIAKKSTSIYQKGGYTRKDVEKNVLSNPFKRFEDMRFLMRCKDVETIEVNPIIFRKLTREDWLRIVDVCDKSLEKYYLRIKK